jgi:hypothetical protein
LSDIFHNGGAVMTPPTGAIFQLVDPAGWIIHEYAAMQWGLLVYTMILIQ